MSRKAYLTDVSDDERRSVVPHLILLRENTAKQVYPLCELFGALRWMDKAVRP